VLSGNLIEIVALSGSAAVDSSGNDGAALVNALG
jgi:hypothetical protein